MPPPYKPRPKRRRRRSRPLENVGNAIHRALAAAGLTDQAERLRIFQSWRQAVGPEIAARTAPQMFSRGTLIVKAASPAWQNELMFLKASIIAQVNELLGKKTVRELKVISGQLPKPTTEPREVFRAPLPKAEDFKVARELSGAIPDAGIRGAFENLIARDKARGRAGLKDTDE